MKTCDSSRLKEGRWNQRSRGFLTRPGPVWTQSSEGEAGLAGATEQRCPLELGVGLDQRASEGDQGSVSSAGRVRSVGPV